MLFNDVLYRIKSGPEIESPERMFTSDKEFVKTYIEGTVGAKYNVPTLAILRSPQDVQAAVFERACVIKPAHGCGQVTFVRPGEEIDRDTLTKQLGENYYDVVRERNYRRLKGKLIVEPLLFEGQDVHDFKVFCWNGEPRCILYVNDRNRFYYRLLFDCNWLPLPVELSPFGIEKPLPDPPKVLPEMLSVAARLSRPFSFVRIDFYIDDDKLLVGEITHCHQGANEQFASIKQEQMLSDHIWKSNSSEATNKPAPLAL